MMDIIANYFATSNVILIIARCMPYIVRAVRTMAGRLAIGLDVISETDE
jgi:hypothetical protein